MGWRKLDRLLLRNTLLKSEWEFGNASHQGKQDVLKALGKELINSVTNPDNVEHPVMRSAFFEMTKAFAPESTDAWQLHEEVKLGTSERQTGRQTQGKRHRHAM